MDFAKLWNDLKGLFRSQGYQLRAIKEVDSWDGAASNYSDTEAYCNACLINVNPESGRTDAVDWTQDHCALPVREEGDGSDTYVDRAVLAAAGGRGITQVERPDDVSTEDWDTALTSAANEIISAYGQMDEMAPDSVYEIAGREPPEERAMSLGQIYEQVNYATWDSDYWLHELYTDDDGQMYAIAVGMGKLYQTPISVMGGQVEVGEWQEVEVQHVPVMRQTFTVTRQEDGLYRWAGIACTAVLNKDAEIDSTTLFDNFVERFERRDRATNPVRLDFFHEDIFLGEVDYIEREGYVLVASGLLDEGLGAAIARGLDNDPGAWGMSISYDPKDKPEFIEAGEGVTFPVWTDGELQRIALLPTKRAAAWFTTFNTMRRETMREETLEALKQLVGDEQALALAGGVDDVNRQVDDNGLISREQEPEPEGEAHQEPSSEAEVIRAIREGQAQTEAVLRGLVEALNTTNEAVTGLSERLAAVEQNEEERRRAYVEDLPIRPPKIVVRPRERNRVPDDEQAPMTSDEIVKRNLAAKGLI